MSAQALAISHLAQDYETPTSLEQQNRVLLDKIVRQKAELEKVVHAIARCHGRLFYLRQLEDGWHDGVGFRPSKYAVTAAGSLLTERPLLAKAFSIFPTLEGGVLFEFEVNGWGYSVEIDKDGSPEFFGIEIDGSDEFEAIRFPALAEDFLVQLDRRVKG